MTLSEDLDTISPYAQVNEVDSEDEYDMLISTCMTHCNVNDGGVEAMVEK